MRYPITSLLQDDWYKYTMLDFILHQHPGIIVKYAFKCRNKPGELGIAPAEVVDEVNAAIDHLCTLRFTEKEIEWLESFDYRKKDGYLHPALFEFLRLFKFNRSYIKVWADGDDLCIEIEGPWEYTILFEIPTLQIVSSAINMKRCPEAFLSAQKAEEGTYNVDHAHPMVQAANDVLTENIKLANAGSFCFRFADFSLRRAFGTGWQEHCVKRFLREAQGVFVGTSNAYLAFKYGISPIGTMAHELLQAYQALVRLRNFQTKCFEDWAYHFRGNVGIALSDIVGHKAFLRDFDKFLTKLYDGARHDSGDPYEWGEALIAHYDEMRVPAHHKSLVFSDGLDFVKGIKLCSHFYDRAIPSCGIGTNFAHDIPGLVPPKIVLKMVECNGQPVAKLSDSPGKAMCRDANYMERLKEIHHVR
jgi:nicotinate phosphoribosyltransferase